MSIVLNGLKIATPGLETVSWLDDPHVPQATDGSPRTKWIRAIVLHTVHGKIGALKAGFKASTRAEAYAKYQANTSRDVSWDYTIDTDGTIIVSNDPLKKFTWQATSVNPFTLGIEFVQDDDGAVYSGQMDAGVKFLDFLTRELAKAGHPVPRCVPVTAEGKPVKAEGKPVKGVIPRIAKADTAASVCGIYGHRNQTTNRGPGDPGDHIFNALLAAGYKGFHYETGQDLDFWKGIQQQLGITGSSADGVPGRATQEKLMAAGHKYGLWTPRPGD